MVLRSPESAQALGFIFFLPSFVSNAFVPTQGMPAWLQAPPTEPAVRAGASRRVLFGGPNPAASVQAWPMQHPQLPCCSGRPG
jgi:hypothetical protein